MYRSDSRCALHRKRNGIVTCGDRAIWCAQPKRNNIVTLRDSAKTLPNPSLAVTYACVGRISEAREVLGELLKQRQSHYVRADRIAGIYATLGQPNEAFSWLEIAFREHSSSLPNIVFRSEFESLQSDPRFDDLLRRVGRDSAAVKSALPKSLRDERRVWGRCRALFLIRR